MIKSNRLIFLIILIWLAEQAIRDNMRRCSSPHIYYRDIFTKISNIRKQLDGSQNNQKHPMWGSSHRPLMRVAPSAFADYRKFPSGQDRPSPRIISNLVCNLQDQELEQQPLKLSGIFLVWGQFISHDLHHTPPQQGSAAEQWPITIPKGDKYFDAEGQGNKTMQFFRSIHEEKSGQPRQQINLLNSWFDGQMIYGSDQISAAALRVFRNGKLKLDENQLLTRQSGGFKSGDARINQNIVLTAINNLFARQHNRICDYFKKMQKFYGKYTDEELYRFAKNFVTALICKITYDDFLPLLLGKQNDLETYKGYNSDIDPTISNIFSTAAFRYGHFMIPDFMFKANNDGEIIEKIRVRDGTRNPKHISKYEDIGAILKGESLNIIKKRDPRVTNQMRNFLVTMPNNREFLLDLAALNIQRGRDHGLPDYNTYRRYLGLSEYVSFNQLTQDKQMLQKLEECYKDINRLDPFIGLMAQKSLPNSSIGELGSAIIRHTLSRVRDGDRFWYQDAFPEQVIEEIKRTSLSDIITRNTQISSMSDDAFRVLDPKI